MFGPITDLCVGHRLIVAREFQFNLRDVSICKEGQPFGSVQTRRIIVNDEINLFRSGLGTLMVSSPLSALGPKRPVVSGRQDGPSSAASPVVI